MAKQDDLFMRMCNEATEELASGRTGWKDADPNTLILACFGMMFNHMTTKIAKPLWIFALSIASGVAGYILVEVITRVGG